MVTRNVKATKHSVQSNENYLDPEFVHDLQTRLRCLEGHVRGIQRMLDEHAACEELLIQTSAVRAALNQINIKIVQGYFQTCVIECVKQDNIPDAVDILQSVLTQALKNG